MTILSLDYETYCDLDLRKVGLDVYSQHPSCEVLMCAYRFDDEEQQFWDATEEPMPARLRAALLDPHVEKWAFNAQFERVITRRVLKLKTPTRGWRCTMVLGFMLSFSGNLDEMGRQINIPADKAKIADGKRLMRMFSMPQRVTKNQPHARLTKKERPEDWQRYCDYCRGDEIAERYIRSKFIPYARSHRRYDWEWHLYEIDQRINDRGIPMDAQFSRNALAMAKRRQDEIVSEMRKLTGLANPNSPAQLLGWLRERGYWFNDLGKDTVKKVLAENGTGNYSLTDDAVKVLKLRQWAARISIKKHDTLLSVADLRKRVVRFLYQFAGASRTNRWAGRKVQTQNLPRTPKNIEEYELLVIATNAIRDGDYDFLDLFVSEIMEALVGTVRSAFRTDDDEEFVVCDLSSIESCVIGWLFKCERLLNVFRNGLDAYKDFATELFGVLYDQVTKKQRTDAKPAVLGCGYRLGGGELTDEGKKTGLWGYAENMGINLDKEQCHKAVEKFRTTYPEIKQGWFDIEDAVIACVKTGIAQKCGYLRFEMVGGNKFLKMTLPSGRPIFYYKPRLVQRYWSDGKPRKKLSFTYMGQDQKSGQWKRLENHGGRFTEQAVQGIARDVLAEGIKQAWKIGFDIRGHVHDEIKTVRKRGDARFSLDRLRQAMIRPLPWAPGLPLGGAGWEGPLYRKD